MYLFKAPILAFAFLLLLAIPESSFAQQCSAQAGKIYGCRSGIACNTPNKRTGAAFWQCQEGPPPSSASSSSSDSGSSSAASSAPAKKSSSKKSSKSSTASNGGCDSDSKPGENGGCIPLEESEATKARRESTGVTAAEEEAGVSSSSSSSTSMKSILDDARSRSMCGSGAFLVVSPTPGSDSAEVGDFNGHSTNNNTYEFCRKNGVSQADADAANRKKSSNSEKETCKMLNGQEYVENGARLCRYADKDLKKPMICGVGDDGYIEECKAEEEAKVADGGSCEKRFNDARDVCLAQADKASTDCNDENQGIQDAMAATKAVGAGSAVSMQLACSKLGEISKIANVSLTGWQTFCSFSQSGCETACSDAKTLYNDPNCIPQANKPSYASDLKTIQENVNVCLGYKKRISEAAQHATAALVQLQAAKKCETDTSALTTASLDECKKNPNNPLCTDAQKCSNAEFAASNQVCKCINNSNSKDCVAGNALAGSRGVAGATIPGVGSGKDTDPGAAFIPPTSGSGTDAFAQSLQSGATKDSQNLGGAKGNASLGGNGGGHGGGGGAGSAAVGAGGAPGDDKLKINSGFYGGANGGGYLGRAGGAYAAGRANAGGVNYNKLGAGGAQFDPRRYIAGLNGKTGEYINGPNMDIFRIVKNRIESKKPTMLDPDFKK